MKINVVLDKGAYMPEKAHSADAGFDLRTPIEFYLPAKESKTIDVGVHMEIPFGYVGFIKSKSGLNVKHGILTEGVIDSGYTGSIRVKLYNNNESGCLFSVGAKITQIVILPIPEVELEQVSALKDTERGNGGFGSTGK